MTDAHEHVFDDRTPGVEEHEPSASYLSYTVGLGLAICQAIIKAHGGEIEAHRRTPGARFEFTLPAAGAT